MYLRITKGRQKSYLVIVEGYRHEGKVKQRTICNLGEVNDQGNKKNMLDLGSKILKHCGAASIIDGSELNEESRRNWGAYELLQRLWERYSLGSLFEELQQGRKLQYDLENTLQLMLAGRLCNPTSKLALYENQELYAGFSDTTLQNLYKSLDELYRYQDAINAHLFKAQSAINGKARITFFDVTTLYFESQKADNLRDFDYSKDCKFNEVQIVLSLLTNEEGSPLACEIFKGNMYEGHTLEKCIYALKEKYKMDRIIIVADRGLYNKNNLELISFTGFEYIVGTRLRISASKIRSEVFIDEGYKEINDGKDKEYKFKYKQIQNKRSEEHTENIIIAWSEKRAIKDRKDRQRLIDKAYDLVSRGQVNDKRGAKKYIQMATSKEVEINKTKIEADELWDGYYGISTNSDLKGEEIIGAYHDLWRIEDSFRLMKSHFEVRPMFHWTEKRIQGHIMLNFIGMIFERHIEKLFMVDKAEDETISPGKIRSAINGMQRSLINVEGAKFYNYAKLSRLGQSILEKLSIPIPKPTKIS